MDEGEMWGWLFRLFGGQEEKTKATIAADAIRDVIVESEQAQARIEENQRRMLGTLDRIESDMEGYKAELRMNERVIRDERK